MFLIFAQFVVFHLIAVSALAKCGGGKKKENEMDKLKPKAPAPAAGGDGDGSVKNVVAQKDADDMETVDGCKSNWGAVQKTK